MKNIFEEKVKQYMDDVINWRRHLHQNPELSFEEYETTNYIISILEPLENIEILRPTKTGVIGVLKGSHPGKIIGLRADIDALAVNEETDVEFKSTKPNIMHACGHDGHTAMLLATAVIANDYVDDIHGEIKFIFQPAEEVPPGGAKEMIESGALDDVDYFFGQHLMPTSPTGTIAMKIGTMFASSDRFDITFQGKGGHAAMPHLAIDPVLIAVEAIQAFQTIVSRKTHPHYNGTISTTVVNTVGAENVIPDTINIKGSVRNYDATVRDETEKYIIQIAEGVAKTHGGSANIIYDRGYSPVVNDEACFDISYAAAEAFLDEKDIIIEKAPQTASEDFSEYNKLAPGNYVLIGSKNDEKGANMSPHHPKYMVDEDALYFGIMQFLNTIAKALM